MPNPLRIGIVAGETSGDILGAGLIRSLRAKYPDLVVEGIGGELMHAEGCISHYPMERLSVMGLVEVLGRLFELLNARKKLIQYFLDNPPDVFIGVDAPDFTLSMEGRLKAAGIPTVHYVSPSVWAWKRKRIFKIKQTTDLVLALFPFEPACYKETAQRIEFVGHPLADQIAQDESLRAPRARFGLDDSQSVVALLPGSRGSEVKYLAEPFLQTARWLAEKKPDLVFLLPAANQQRYNELELLINEQYADLNLQLVLQQSRQAMAAADAILIASGTATLEATILKKPMVVAYKMASLTYAIYSRMIKSRFVSLPNLLADEALVPEILQADVTSNILGEAVLKALSDRVYIDYVQQRFEEVCAQLHQDADEKAACAIVKLLEDKGVL
ncbi:lipid-A-disaccharide synthase [Neptuniibacter pectenicola]|jgi:lipid-A-disaccharide synthase|uniref:lipid-A-disaccharide synthase n=1 Tax=Neptuniibacter pectenicola TaxID=1806669 RepID=UPI003EEE14F0